MARVGNGLTLLLLAACVAAALLVQARWQQLERPQAALPDGAPTLAASATGGDTEVLLGGVAEAPVFPDAALVLERPLFEQGRRPPQAPAADAPLAAQQLPPFDYLLEGVAMVEDRRIALLRGRSNRSQLHLAEGESVDGWQLERIGAAEAEFSSARGRLTVELEAPRDPGSAPVQWRQGN